MADRRAKYPWTEWADGEEHTAVYGKDFTCGVPSLITLLHQKVRYLEGVSHVTTSVNGEEVTFKYYMEADEPQSPLKTPSDTPNTPNTPERPS